MIDKKHFDDRRDQTIAVIAGSCKTCVKVASKMYDAAYKHALSDIKKLDPVDERVERELTELRQLIGGSK